MTQNKMIIAHMKKASITPLEALKKYGCLRLASRICEIKDMGYNVKSDMFYAENGKRMEYWL